MLHQIPWRRRLAVRLTAAATTIALTTIGALAVHGLLTLLCRDWGRARGRWNYGRGQRRGQGFEPALSGHTEPASSRSTTPDGPRP